MSIYDFFTLAILFSLCTLGYTRGFVPLLIGVVTWYGAMMFSILFYPQTKELVISFLTINAISGYVTVIVNFAIFSVALYFITQPFLDSRQGGTPPSSLDRLVGLGTGLAVTLIVLATFELAVIKVNSNSRPKWIMSSATHKVTSQVAKPISAVFGENMSKMLYDLGINKAKLG